MRGLFESFGIDFDQWKALTAAALKLDFRQSLFGRARFGRSARGVAALISQFIFYSLLGGFMAAGVFFIPDLFLSAAIIITYVMFMIGTAVLIDHGSAVTSPTDYAVLGFRPVSSRTYFAVRLGNALAYTTAMTTVFAYLPIGAFFLRYHAAVGLASVAAIYACATTTALGIITAYAWLMQAIGPDRLKRVLSYVQLVLGFVVYGGYFIASQFLASNMITSLRLSKAPWMLLDPATWFVSYIEMAAGQITLLEIAPALASVLLFAVLLSGLSGRLSLDYAQRLGELATSGARAPRRADAGRRSLQPGVIFRSNEARAVALLVRSQFRNDLRFRMTMLSIVPLTVLYVIMGVTRGNVDSALSGSYHRGGFSLVTVAVLTFPMMLKMNLTRSDAFRASWIFFACPADRAKVVRAAKNVLVAFFLVPYLLFVGALLSYFSGDVFRVAVHLVFIGLISHFMLQAISLFDPELPFSKPVVKGRSSSMVFALMIAMGIVSGLLPLVTPALYGSLIYMGVALVTLVILSGFLDRLTRLRVASLARRLEFEG